MVRIVATWGDSCVSVYDTQGTTAVTFRGRYGLGAMSTPFEHTTDVSVE